MFKKLLTNVVILNIKDFLRPTMILRYGNGQSHKVY